MLADNRERDRLLATATEFEAELRRNPITARSPCGRVTIRCDHRGSLIKVIISDKFPSTVDIDDAERLIMNTLNAAVAAPETVRDRFYNGLTVFGDTIANLKKYPPTPRSREAMAVGFVDVLRAGMMLRPDSYFSEGTGHDRR